MILIRSVLFPFIFSLINRLNLSRISSGLLAPPDDMRQFLTSFIVIIICLRLDTISMKACVNISRSSSGDDSCRLKSGNFFSSSSLLYQIWVSLQFLIQQQFFHSLMVLSLSSIHHSILLLFHLDKDLLHVWVILK